MAPSPRLKTFNPKTLWIMMVGSAITLLTLGLVTILWITSLQNRQLVSHEFQILFRSNAQKLEAKNYRDFAESFGLSPTDFFLSIHTISRDSNFSYGLETLEVTGQCTTESYFEYDAKFCRPVPIPWFFISIAISLFAILLFIFLLTLRHINSSMLRSFRSLFETAQIEHPSNLSFSQAWYIANHLANQFLASQERAVRAEGQKLLAETAVQVAHDIRGPLSALSIALSKLPTEDPAVALIKAASSRIKSIANDLLEKRKSIASMSPCESVSCREIDSQISNLLKEKEALFPNAFFDFKSLTGASSLSTRIDKTWFVRVLSNIINNSCESLPTGRVKVSVSTTVTERELIIEVTDNGSGIEEDTLKKVLTAGYSTKVDGNGIGLHTAINKIKEWKGSLNLKSNFGCGTIVEIRLPFYRHE